MNRAARIALFSVVVLLAGVAGYMLSAPKQFEKADVSPILEATMPDLSGKPTQIAVWRGKVLVINFWATWCPPCLEEIPHFVRMQSQMGEQGLQFIGIAIDERDKVLAFAKRHAINYPIVIGQLDAIELSRRAGNAQGGLPYTLILNRSGEVVSQYYGGVTEELLKPIIAELL